jgi:hypothetical protein
MTEPQDDHSSTRPISVAELLAKNGTIGAPPVGGRRRRRRGNADSVTVAELTGEIPVVTHDVEPPAPSDDVADVAELDVDETPDEVAEAPVESAASNGVVEHAPVQAPSEAEAEYAAHLEQRDADPEPLDFAPPPRRAHLAPRTGFSAPTGGAEQMSPDPLVDDDDDDGDDDLALLDIDDIDEIDDVDDVSPGPYDAKAEDAPAPSYRRSSADTLFGGQSVADDLARRGRQPGPEDIDLGDEDVKPANVAPSEVAEERGSSFLRGVWVVAQCILAVAFGAGLFIAFDQLWKWNSIVALVLGVLVILGLVVGVRVVRKTEDIGSTLIAVAVGAMVTFGPLALLQAH